MTRTEGKLIEDNRPRLGALDEETEYDIDRYAVAYASCVELQMRANTEELRRWAERAISEKYALLETLRARIRELSGASQKGDRAE